jgi:hypothetical protein
MGSRKIVREGKGEKWKAVVCSPNSPDAPGPTCGTEALQETVEPFQRSLERRSKGRPSQDLRAKLVLMKGVGRENDRKRGANKTHSSFMLQGETGKRGGCTDTHTPAEGAKS